jgi:hypothetical protein
MRFLYSGWAVMRSTATTTVFSILSLTTRPTIILRPGLGVAPVAWSTSPLLTAGSATQRGRRPRPKCPER